MDDKFARQYDYKANSNLVLQTDTSLIDKRANNEGTGEVQSLAGRLGGKMGDKVASKSSVKPSKREEEEKSRSKRSKKSEPSKLKQELSAPRDFSVAEIETKDLLYQPKTDLTAAVYGLLIKFVRKQLGFQHNSIINGAADEIIGTMKDPKLAEDMRRSEIDRLLSTDQCLDDDDYNELCNLCKKINDWDSDPTKVKEDTAEEESGGIAVLVSDEDVLSDDYLSEVHDDDDEFDLDEMFERAEENNQNNDTELTDFIPKQAKITPKIDIGEPIRKEGYQEYHIVPPKRQSHRNDNLIKIEDLPENQRRAFRDFKSLNLIQSRIYSRAMNSDKSMLICAPTGAGKTNIAILTMLREILKHQREDGSGFRTDKFKIIYVAPIKALVQEIVENFTRRLGCSPYNLKVEELTGDHQLNERQISGSQIIVCTPEKWDIVTRKSIDRLYTKVVKLVIFDEIHLLHNERGATLEALVARIKRHKEIEGESIRIVGLSATLPNYKDVWRFISPEDHDEKSVFYFDSSYRPIPLRQQYIGITETKKALRLINDIVYDKVMERLIDQTQILIFVHSREDTAKTGEFLKTKALEEHKLGLFLSSDSALDKINEADKNMSTKLKELLRFGIGIHHAGLSRPERSCVESLFKEKYIKVLVSTATLAWGVNLPARTVIIKGTQLYSSRDGRWTDLDSLDVTQMLGRAGRPGYDKEGEGIVITQQSQVPFYMSLMTEQLPVESKLIARLAEFLNAECVVENIESLEDGCEWLNETFLSSRMASILDQTDNRQYLTIYGIKPDAKITDPKLMEHKKYLVDTALRTLDKRGLIVYDRLSGAVKSTELGRIASIFNCSSRTIKMFYDSIHEFTSDIELFRTFSLADEFKDIYVRRGEEVDFQTLLNQIPFPIDDKRATPGANKVNALLQVYIFRMNIESSDLISDMHFVRDNAPRLSRAIHEIVLMKGYALVAELSFDLCRKIDKRMTVCHTPLRQFSADLDADIINRLEKKNYHIDELRALKADKICELLRCERKYGEIVYRLLKCLPRLKIEASVKPVSKNSLKIELSIQPDFSWSDKYHGYSEQFWLLVEDVNQETLLHYEIVHIKKNRQHEKTTTTFYVPYLVPMQPFYYLRILPDKWFGSDHHLPIYIEKLSLPDEVVNYTQALDLEPQPVRSLENALFESIYEDKFKGANFNQFQTQAFKHIYLSDDDLILLASAGSGKTTCAELAIIRNINLRGTGSKCAYIAANSQSAQMVFDSWTKLFGRHYGLVFLTGNHRVDAGRVDSESANIVIGDPSSWHVLTLTRSKKYRKLLSKFHLFIIDDIHLLHNDENSTLEWLCSKIRITTKLNASDKPARIVALGSPMASTDSIKSWLAFERGTKEPILLNYPPSIRPVKLELTVQRYHHYDYKMRLLTMQRPVYRHIINAKDKPALIFVADFHQAQVVCESLISYSRKKGGHKFARPMVSLSGVSDRDLKEYLVKGIGFLYLGMSPEDKALVERLFDSGQLMILVSTVAMCWSIQSRSNLTIIMDTQQHNGIEGIEYKLTDMMQMIGLTGRPMADHDCSCIVMCHYSKANHYERFLREPLSTESELPSNLISHVSYEVATGEITELNNIYKPYLAHTFFYKRISVNPNYYGIILPEGSEQKSKVFGSFFNNLVNKVALDLDKNEFIAMEGSHENPNFTAGLLSRISLEYYINYETLSNYTKWLAATGKQDIRPFELIELISTSTFEFRSTPVRNGELHNLKSLQRRHRPREGDQIHEVGFKIKLLILSQYQKTDGKPDELEGELIADRWFVITMSHRLLMAIVDIAWLKDSFSLAKTAIQLSKKIVPFTRSTQPNIDMETSISRQGDEIEIGITVKRENEPFCLDEFNRSFSSLPTSMYRDEGWCFLIHGQPRVKKSEEPDKFLLFKRVKTPTIGINEYKLNFAPTENASAYTYDLYLMSDFYSTKEDRKVADIDVHDP